MSYGLDWASVIFGWKADLASLASSSGLSVLLRHDPVGLGVGKCHATAGVDLVSPGCAPRGECVGVDVSLDNDPALLDLSLADLFGFLLPLLESVGEGVAVNEDGTQSLIVRFTIPSDPNGLDGRG